MAVAKPKKNPKQMTSAEDILTAALGQAEDVGWGSVRLHQIATEIGIPLSTLLTRFKDQNAIADFWFQSALEAMLAPTDESFPELLPKERLFVVIMRWFDALAEHRRVTLQMIAIKCHLPHPHHWTPLVFSLSRLVQWIREAAKLGANGHRRQIEEIGLTVLILAILKVWARDDTENQDRTRQVLRRRLDLADRFLR